jgi:hypothetical protein
MISYEMTTEMPLIHAGVEISHGVLRHEIVVGLPILTTLQSPDSMSNFLELIYT